MSDTERVFALYVQTNPVPDPDLLPTRPADAALPMTEGSPDMDTQEKIEIRPRPAVRRRRPVAIAVAAFVVVLGVVGIGLVLTQGDGEPVAAADARPSITFDGEACNYDGPSLITQGLMTFSFANTSAGDAGFAVWWMPESTLSDELERTPLGSEMALPPGSAMPAGTLAAELSAAAGDTVTARGYLTAGTALVDCVTYGPVEPDHVWRAGRMIEVVAP